MKLRSKFSIICFCLLGNVSSHASIRSISVEQSVEIEQKNYKLSHVKCVSRSSPAKILQAEGQKQWCDSSISDMCDNTKLGLAIRVCSSDYTQSLATRERKNLNINTNTPRPDQPKPADVGQPSTSVDSFKLKNELIDVQERLLEIKLKQLELSKRKMKLIQSKHENEAIVYKN